MAPAIQLVIRLQSLDDRISSLQREVASLPRHIVQIEKALEGHRRKLEADQAALVANQKERKKLEGGIQVQEQKISKLKDQMLEARTNEQYRAFQHEIEYCEKAIRQAEDRILDLMAESEPLERNLKEAEAALKQEKQQVEVEKARARERTASDEKQIQELKTERAGVVAELDPQTYRTYERIRKKWHGLAVAIGTDGRCSACNIILRPQFYQDLRKGEKLMTCESCGRLLYYNPPVEFEDQAGSPESEVRSQN
jgi:predicted  nucleic acid-binding Zn-ribbon protein